MSGLTEALGLDRGRLAFGMRTALAASAALLLAWALGLEHPQWSAMTVWAASLPVRGQLVEKSAYRLLGTIIGALYGMGLMVVSGGAPELLVLGLALWLGLCGFTGNLLRGFASYGAMLAGYSAAMVTLLDSAHPDHILALGLDRMLTVALGVLTALPAGLLFAAPGRAADALQRTRALTAPLLRDIASRLAGRRLERAGQETLLAEMAAIEMTLDLEGAGSRRARRMVREARGLLLAQVAALLWLRAHEAGPAEADAQLGAALEAAAGAEDEPTGLLRAAAAAEADHPGLAEVLDGLAAAAAPGGQATPLALHRNWIGGAEAMVRSVLAALAVGSVWLATGWDMGGFMLLGTAILTSIFSTFENPVVSLRYVFIGQIAGVVAALTCRWFVWPWAGSEAGLVLAILSFILLGGIPGAHARTAPMAFDCNMVMLLLLQPVWPQTMGFGHSLMMGAAVLGGPLISLAAFRLIHPVDATRRREALRRATVADLERLASGGEARDTCEAWQMRNLHRLLVATFLSSRAMPASRAVADHGLGFLTVGSAIRHLHRLEAHLLPDTERRRVGLALARLGMLGRDPAAAGRALAVAARGLSGREGVDRDLLAEAWRQIAAHPGLFASGADVPYFGLAGRSIAASWARIAVPSPCSWAAGRRSASVSRRQWPSA